MRLQHQWWSVLVAAAEALRTAMRAFGNQPLTGAQVQWGFEHLTLTAASLKALGAEGLLAPFSLSCDDVTFAPAGISADEAPYLGDVATDEHGMIHRR